MLVFVWWQFCVRISLAVVLAMCLDHSFAQNFPVINGREADHALSLRAMPLLPCALPALPLVPLVPRGNGDAAAGPDRAAANSKAPFGPFQIRDARGFLTPRGHLEKTLWKLQAPVPCAACRRPGPEWQLDNVDDIIDKFFDKAVVLLGETGVLALPSYGTVRVTKGVL
jgi:hypothetical protein